ncbi:trissin receptor-like [Aplysia californica]|uniref:Trissin receptor-like n=1 Tax=Aplysia californica TaxID=6500 RepID=A0ABM0K3K7_APLCA|nr:trissin receptor-like [Aplysia californica]
MFCKVSPFLQTTAVAVSVLSMLSISINRYFAIHVPLRAKILFSRARVHVMLASIWTLGLSAASPLLFVKTVTTYGIPGVYVARVCQEIWSKTILKHAYNMTIFLQFFLCPLLVMSVLYLKISVALWSNNRELFHTAPKQQTFMSPQVDRLLLQRRKTVRTLVLLVVLFACSWLPYYVVNAWLDLNAGSSHAGRVNSYVYPLAQLVSLSNSSVNPILYCFLSNGFRRALTNMCCCRRNIRARHSMAMTVRYRCSDDSGLGSVDTVLS